jgi:hypothetical protein
MFPTVAGDHQLSLPVLVAATALFLTMVMCMSDHKSVSDFRSFIEHFQWLKEV